MADCDERLLESKPTVDRDERYWLVLPDEFDHGPFHTMEVVARTGRLRIVKTDRLGSARILAHGSPHGSHHEFHRDEMCGSGLEVSQFLVDKLRYRFRHLWLDPQGLLDLLHELWQRGLAVRGPSELVYPTEIRTLTALVDQTELSDFWTDFTTLYAPRQCEVQPGADAATWLQAYLTTLLGARAGATATLDVVVPVPNTVKQRSVVVWLPGTESGNHPGVVLGCHVDTVEGSPGGDDDASGVATLVEALRAIVVSGQSFRGDVYFMFHAAEELGNLGSAQLAVSFSTRTPPIPIAAMIQFDMCGCPAVPADEGKIFLTDDSGRTNTSVNDKLAAIIDDSLNKLYGTTYATRINNAGASDHAAWAFNGFPVAFPFEALTEHTRKHQPDDTIAEAGHMTHFARLAVAAAVEYAEPV